MMRKIMNDIDSVLEKHNIITRLEIIDENGRVYTRWNVNIIPSIQDEGRTLKIFVQETDHNAWDGKPKC